MLIFSAIMALTGCSDGESRSGGGLLTPDIEYQVEDDRYDAVRGRIMAVIERSVFRRYYEALINKITIMAGNRHELAYLGWISEGHVRIAGDSIPTLTDRQIDYLIAHEAEHRAEGIVTGWDDPEHRTPDQCLPDRGNHPKCHFEAAYQWIMAN